jgi:hypothetical protein
MVPERVFLLVQLHDDKADVINDLSAPELLRQHCKAAGRDFHSQRIAPMQKIHI